MYRYYPSALSGARSSLDAHTYSKPNTVLLSSTQVLDISQMVTETAPTSSIGNPAHSKFFFITTAKPNIVNYSQPS